MQEYSSKTIEKRTYLETPTNNVKKRDFFNYEIDNSNYSIIKELQLAPSRISELEGNVLLMGDCGSCPSCACISGGLQFLAVIEAPATVPLLVIVGGIRLAS